VYGACEGPRQGGGTPHLLQGTLSRLANCAGMTTPPRQPPSAPRPAPDDSIHAPGGASSKAERAARNAGDHQLNPDERARLAAEASRDEDA
jgi:hypothetical protein